MLCYVLNVVNDLWDSLERCDVLLVKVLPVMSQSVYCWQLRLIRLVGIMLVIFVRSPLYDLVRDCSAQSVGTGLLGMMVCADEYAYVHVSMSIDSL